MIFTTGQILGIGAFTAVVLGIGALLYKLDTMIGTNYDTADTGPSSEPSGATAETAQAASSGAPKHSPHVTSHRRKRRH